MSIGKHERCPNCKEWGWFGGTYMNHVCKPRWECRGEWEDDSCWTAIHARDSEDAAEKFADRYDCEGGEYAIVSGRGRGRGDWIVLVRKPKDDDTDRLVERYAVEGEAVPQYRATKIDDPPPVDQSTSHASDERQD